MYYVLIDSPVSAFFAAGRNPRLDPGAAVPRVARGVPVSGRAEVARLRARGSRGLARKKSAPRDWWASPSARPSSRVVHADKAKRRLPNREPALRRIRGPPFRAYAAAWVAP